jgi:hypothetical protein
MARDLAWVTRGPPCAINGARRPPGCRPSESVGGEAVKLRPHQAGNQQRMVRTWALTMEAVVNATACSDEAARDFLDSRYGRHLADEVVNALVGRLELPAAIDSAVARWMRRRIDSRIQDELGTPKACRT